MKRIIALCFTIACAANFSFAQIKIHVENLKPPTDTLQEQDYTNALKNIVYEYKKLNTRNYKDSFDKKTFRIISHILLSDSFQYNFIAKNKTDKPLVIATPHAFYDAMFEAYAHHRPFVLSPDMIWLLIAQGFAQHINNNAEKLRHYFVQHEGKISLIVKDNSIRLDNPNSPWEKAFSDFNNQISAYTGNGLIDVLTNNFSTTTPIARVASQITAMESMKAYFEFVVIRISCGIPDITLEGTPQDWEKLRTKAQYLKRYELGWWIDSLDPVLQKIVAASKGEKDTTFWKAMFKYHEGGCGAPSFSNGWIVKFFPYNKDGHRNNLDTIYGSGMLPPEIVQVPLKYVSVNDDGSTKNTDLELWAGFVGSTQNTENFTLNPQIGWMIRKKDADNNDKDFLDKFYQQRDRVVLRVNQFSKALLQIPHIQNLELDFTDSIHIPDEIKNIQIDNLQLRGKISLEETVKIEEFLPNTTLIINNTDCTSPDNKNFTDILLHSNNDFWPYTLHVRKFPKAMLSLDTVKSREYKIFPNAKPVTLSIDTFKSFQIDFTDSVFIPEEAKKIHFQTLYINGKISKDEEQKIISMYPSTMLFINYQLKSNDTTVRSYFLEKDLGYNHWIVFKTTDFPQQFLKLKSIQNLSLNYIDSIQIPDKIQSLKIQHLYLSGKITKQEEEKIFHLLPKTVLSFNNFLYARSVTKNYLKEVFDNTRDKRFGTFIEVSDFPDALLQEDSIDNLILNYEDSIHIPGEIKNIQIKKLFLQGKITEQEEKRISELLPKTELYFNGKKYQQ